MWGGGCVPDLTTLALLGLAVLALGGGLAYVLARRNRGLRDARDAYYHFRCPSCKRRLRYRSAQVGHKGKCSHCASPVTFPPVSQSVD
jgi:hypothetical protein